VSTVDPTRNVTLLTARQVADLIGVDVRTVWRMAQTGDLPTPIRLFQRVVRWRLADLDTHLANLASGKGGRR